MKAFIHHFGCSVYNYSFDGNMIILRTLRLPYLVSTVLKSFSSTVPQANQEYERLYSKINVKVKGVDYAVLDSYMKFVITSGKALGIDIGGKVALPTHTQKFTVLKSPHVYKKHRVQYEIRTHSRLVQIKHLTGTTSDVFLEYIQRNLPEGVSMSVYQEELSALPKLLMPDKGDIETKTA